MEKDKPNSELTSKECVNAIKRAIKEFGRYSYYDKGAQEVMDMAEFVNKIRNLPASKASAILIEVQEYEHGNRLVEHVLYSCQIHQLNGLLTYCPMNV